MVSLGLSPIFAFSKREMMLISKLAQAFGEGAFVTLFAVVLCTVGVASPSCLMGRLCQTSWVSCPEGWHGGRMQVLDDDLGSLTSFWHFSVLWHKMVMGLGKGFWKAQRPVLVAHVWDLSSSQKSRWGNQPSLPELWHWPALGQQNRLHVCWDVNVQYRSAVLEHKTGGCVPAEACVLLWLGRNALGWQGCSGLANWVPTPEGNKQRKYLFLLPYMSPQQDSCPQSHPNLWTEVQLLYFVPHLQRLPCLLLLQTYLNTVLVMTQ